MTPSALSTATRRLPPSRFGAALCLSALAHFAMPLWVSGGGARTSASAPPRPALSVRIMPQLEALATDPSILPTVAETPAEPRPRAERVERREPVVSAAPLEPQPARPAGGVPEAPDLNYYPARQLDIYPKLLSALDLKYRGKAAEDGVTGRALLLVLIDEAGTVNEVSVVEAEPVNVFEDDAQRALMAARFTPAYRNGRAVRSRVLIAVNYGVERNAP